MNHGGTLQCNEMDKEVFNEILLKKRKIVDLELILTPHAEGHYVSMTWGPEEKRTFLGHTLARAGEAQLTFADDRTLRLCYRHLGRGKHRDCLKLWQGPNESESKAVVAKIVPSPSDLATWEDFKFLRECEEKGVNVANLPKALACFNSKRTVAQIMLGQPTATVLITTISGAGVNICNVINGLSPGYMRNKFWLQYISWASAALLESIEKLGGIYQDCHSSNIVLLKWPTETFSFSIVDASGILPIGFGKGGSKKAHTALSYWLDNCIRYLDNPYNTNLARLAGSVIQDGTIAFSQSSKKDSLTQALYDFGNMACQCLVVLQQHHDPTTFQRDVQQIVQDWLSGHFSKDGSRQSKIAKDKSKGLVPNLEDPGKEKKRKQDRPVTPPRESVKKIKEEEKKRQHDRPVTPPRGGPHKQVESTWCNESEVDYDADDADDAEDGEDGNDDEEVLIRFKKYLQQIRQRIPQEAVDKTQDNVLSWNVRIDTTAPRPQTKIKNRNVRLDRLSFLMVVGVLKSFVVGMTQVMHKLHDEGFVGTKGLDKFMEKASKGQYWRRGMKITKFVDLLQKHNSNIATRLNDAYGESVEIILLNLRAWYPLESLRDIFVEILWYSAENVESEKKTWLQHSLWHDVLRYYDKNSPVLRSFISSIAEFVLECWREQQEWMLTELRSRAWPEQNIAEYKRVEPNFDFACKDALLAAMEFGQHDTSVLNQQKFRPVKFFEAYKSARQKWCMTICPDVESFLATPEEFKKQKKSEWAQINQQWQWW